MEGNHFCQHLYVNTQPHMASPYLVSIDFNSGFLHVCCVRLIWNMNYSVFSFKFPQIHSTISMRSAEMTSPSLEQRPQEVSKLLRSLDPANINWMSVEM